MSSKKIKKPITDKNLLLDWDYEKNNGLRPEDFSAGSGKRVWWKCHICGYVWNTTIGNRALSKRGCPACSKSGGHVVFKGHNDLLTLNPNLASEWHPYKNGDLKPSDVRENYSKKVWWLCPRGHSYQATPNHRTQGHTGCPICNNGRQTSFAEQAVYYYVKKLFPSAINRYREIFERGMELDIYIPEINVGIEYDGVYWHRNKTNIIDREKRKYEICQNHNIKLIRIKEKIKDDDFVRADFAISLPTNEAGYMALDHAIMILLQYIDPDCNMRKRKNSTHYWSDIKPDVERDRFEIMSYLSSPIKNSLEVVNPKVAKEWNYDKNGELKPNMVSAGSSLKVHWKCNNCGFEWEAQISHRAKENTGCPKCAGMILDIGINDLATKCPELLQDWDYVENDKIGIKPNEILYNSGQKVFWKCHTCGHVWSREINLRSIQKQGCIKCGYKNNVKTKKEKKIQKEGSIKSEKLLNEWDSELNFPYKPSDFPPSSGYEAHWICSKCGHKWIAPIRLRVKGQRGCRKCADKANPQLLRQNRIKQGRAITNELLLKEWDYKQNYPKTPSDYSNGSGIKVAWICSKCGYKWTAAIHSRNAGSGCPNCAGQVCITGRNDLKTKYPDIAKEWDYVKNKTINPENILPRSNKKYWWICPNGHESYEATPGHRIDGTGCPICARMKISDKSSVKVDQLTKDFVFVKTFNSAKEAESLTGISRSSISQAIRRKSLAGGFRWKHTDKV